MTADHARKLLRAYAFDLYTKSAEKLAEGMECARDSARLEQLAELTNDEEAVKVAQLFIDEGLVMDLSHVAVGEA